MNKNTNSEILSGQINLESFPGGLMIFNEKWELTYANQILLKFLNTTFDKIKLKKWQQAIKFQIEGQSITQKTDFLRKVGGRQFQNRIIEIEFENESQFFLISKNTAFLSGSKIYLFSVANITKFDQPQIHDYMVERNFAKDLRVARKAQKLINNQIIRKLEGKKFMYRTYNSFLPCSYLSGDVLNIHQIDRRHSSLFIGDGRGHGVAAAIYSGMIYSFLNLFTSKIAVEKKNLNEIVADINRTSEHHFSKSNEYYFFSGIFNVIDGDLDILHMVNAGHPPPFLLKQGKVEKLQTHGPVIGVDGKATYDMSTLNLDGTEIFIFYTDGIIELENKNGEMFGINGLSETLQKIQSENTSASQIPDKLLKEGLIFSTGKPVIDDISILVLEVSPKM